eukprot:3332993-Alexandrium_andersonii.AAC.1
MRICAGPLLISTSPPTASPPGQSGNPTQLCAREAQQCDISGHYSPAPLASSTGCAGHGSV